MKPRINRSLKALIPPLQPEELEKLERNELGFEGSRLVHGAESHWMERLTLIPTPMGDPYWIFSLMSSEDNMETFCKRPMAASRMPVKEWEGFALEAVAMEPLWEYPPPSLEHRKSTSDTVYFYFIEAVGTGFVKIGLCTGNASSRLSSFQTGCPHELVLRREFLGDKSDETALHKRYAKQRVRGEWFVITEDMMSATWGTS